MRTGGQDSRQLGGQSDCQDGPARYVRFPGFQGRIGFIDPLSHKFCSECNRIRLTVDGRLKLCLYYAEGLDLRMMIRAGATDEEIRSAIEQALGKKPKEHQWNGTESSEKGENFSGIPETRRMTQIGG